MHDPSPTVRPSLRTTAALLLFGLSTALLVSAAPPDFTVDTATCAKAQRSVEEVAKGGRDSSLRRAAKRSAAARLRVGSAHLPGRHPATFLGD